MRKKIFITLLVYLLVGQTSFFMQVQAEEVSSKTEPKKAEILIESDSKTILHKENEDERLPPASMTKIMTMLLVMEAIDAGKLQLQEKITISENAEGMGGSQVYLEAGEEMTVQDLLKAVAIASANDASVALAEAIAGSEEAFVQLMNEKVKALQLENTHFVNASGLPATNHYSSAYDMAIIAAALLKYESIISYTSTYEDYLRKGTDKEFWLVNTNKLIRHFTYVDGLKTGFTNEAKYCLVATAKQNNMRVISVVMGAENVKERNAMTMHLLHYGLKQYETEKIYEPGDVVERLSLFRSEKGVYDVVVDEPVSLLKKKGEARKADVTTKVTLNENIPLPIDKHTKVGELHVYEGEKKVRTEPVFVKEKVESASFLTLWQRVFTQLTKSVE